MKWLCLLLFTLNAYAIEDEALRQAWLGRAQIADRHTGYPDGAAVNAPAGTWQTLFTVMLSKEKHCVHAKVPVKNRAGEVRIVAVDLNASCSGSWDRPALWERTQLRSIQFSVTDDEVKLWWAESGGRVQSLTSKLPNIRGVFFFSPNADAPSVDIKLVGEVTDVYPANPCSLSEGTCQLCRYGVYRVAGATPEYYCGVDRCGETNAPACARGKRWLKSRGPFSCRGNNEHLFCASGLQIQCEGEVAICR